MSTAHETMSSGSVLAATDLGSWGSTYHRYRCRAVLITGVAVDALVLALLMACEMNVFPRDPAQGIDRWATIGSSADGPLVYAADVAEGTVRSRSRSALRSVSR